MVNLSKNVRQKFENSLAIMNIGVWCAKQAQLFNLKKPASIFIIIYYANNQP